MFADMGWLCVGYFVLSGRVGGSNIPKPPPLQSGPDGPRVSRDSVGGHFCLSDIAFYVDFVSRIGSFLGFWTNFYQERLYR
jgi:hypothetical protein